MTQDGDGTTVPSMAHLPDLMTVAEVAETLRLTDETIHRWCRNGRMEYVDVFGVKRFRRDYITALVESRTRAKGTTPPVELETVA